MADQEFEYDEEKALTQNAFTREHTVTYDGNEGTPAKANDTAIYTFANWGNKDILGYDLDMSSKNEYGGRFDATIYDNYNGYKTASVDNTSGTEYKNIVQWKVDKQFKTGDKYKLTFYAKGNGQLRTFFHGGSSKVAVKEKQQDDSQNSSSSTDGSAIFTLSDTWTKHTIIYTMVSTTDATSSKYVLFRLMPGNTTSIYGVRFEKIENDEHADQEVVSKLTAEPNGTVTLYAVWNPHEVTLPTATREGYIFNGWYDATTGGNKIGNAGDKYIPEANTTLYAQWRQVHYTVSVGEDTLPAETLAEAVGLAEERITGSVTTATITSLMNYADSSTVTISKNIVIDLAGHTITRDKTITNNGTLDIYSSADGGTITGAVDRLIINNGTLTTNGTSAGHTMSLVNTTTKDVTRVIESTLNTCTITLNANTTLEFTNSIQTGTGNRYIVVNRGTSTINGATLRNNSYGTVNERGIVNASSDSDARIIINDGTVINTTGVACKNNGSTKTGDTPAIVVNGENTSITSTKDSSISNNKNGDVTITGGSITADSNIAVFNEKNGTINVTGGTIIGTYGISNNVNGTINVSGATTSITGTSSQGIRGCTGNVTVSDGTINGSEYGISVITENNTSGSALITGGHIISNKYGLFGNGSTTITMGNNDGSVSKTLPEIISNSTNNDDYGVYVTTNATFNFYDGKIEAKDKYTITKDVSAKTDGYQVVKRTADGRETAVLEKEVTVTFEPNPGNTAGATVEPTSKTVLTNTVYGELPTPVKAGYTFNGWRTGKNLFNKDEIEVKSNYYIQGNGTETSHNQFSIYQINVKPNTTYTLTNSGQSSAPGYAVYDSNGTFIAGENYSQRATVSFTTGSTAAYIKFSVVTLDSCYRYDKEIFQIEEGGAATAYEPYYITATTTVVREDNHTLYADWTANPYTVTADANGGIITAANGWTAGIGNLTANKNITYDTAYGTLPTVARIGYTFDKWTGKNLFNKNSTQDNYEILNAYITEKNGWFVTDFIEVEAGKTYYISGKTEGRAIVYYDSNKTNKGRLFDQIVGTITIPDNVKYIKMNGLLTEKDTLQIEEGSTATSYEPYKTITAESILATDCDHKIYAQWTPRTDTAYTVNHYTHDLDASTYTLNSTDNLQGTSDAIVTLDNLKKTIAGYTYEEGFITGGTTKPDSGAVVTTTIAADGSRVINLYYRPNYLYVQYHMNGGRLESHAGGYGTSGDLISYNRNTTSTDFLRGVYGSKVGLVSVSTYSVNTAGLHDYNGTSSTGSINIAKTGYIAKTGKEWNTKADGTGTAYSQLTATYKAIDMATACGKDLSAGDQVITLYVNWEPISYTISYDLNNGTNNASNPATYTIESADITLQQPTRNGYTFTNWTEEVSDMYWNFGFLNLSTGVHEISSSYPNSYYTAPIKLKQGVTYRLSGYGAYAASNIRWRLYNLDGSYYKNGPSSNTYTADKDCYVRIMFFSNPTAEQRNGTKLTSSAMSTIVIPQGSTGNRNYTANYTANNYTVTADLNGGAVTSADGWDTTGERPTKSVTYDSAYGTLPTVTKAGYTFDKWTGKNMFDEETLLLAIEGATYTDGHYQFSSSKSRAKYGGTNYLPIENFKENTSYTFSIYGYISNSWWHIRFDYTDGTTDYGKFEITEEGQYELSSNANKTLKYIKFSFGSNATVSISHIQLEEGTTATSYEPYKTITAESLVATDCNHTIHANWTANPYTVTADANGGTIPSTDGWTNAAGNASATKTVYYDSTYGTLPTPTRDGYVFLGWYKENTFVNRVETSTQVTTDSDHTIYAYWTNFTLSKNPIYMNKTTTSIALIAPEGTSGATVTYTGTDIGELTFESEDSNVATVQVNANNTQAVVTTASGAQTGDTTKIIIKDKASGLLLGELNVIIDTELPTWMVRLLSIE